MKELRRFAIHSRIIPTCSPYHFHKQSHLSGPSGLHLSLGEGKPEALNPKPEASQLTLLMMSITCSVALFAWILNVAGHNVG